MCVVVDNDGWWHVRLGNFLSRLALCTCLLLTMCAKSDDRGRR